MDENKNNALEKVENIINGKKHAKTMHVIKNTEQSMDRKVEKERIMAERRIELARIRARKKAEK